MGTRVRERGLKTDLGEWLPFWEEKEKNTESIRIGHRSVRCLEVMEDEKSSGLLREKQGV